jgi:hypothetical protein
MVVNFRACGISQGARKLARTPMLIIIKKSPTLVHFPVYNSVASCPLLDKDLGSNKDI